jgi:hypothetical protein
MAAVMGFAMDKHRLLARKVAAGHAATPVPGAITLDPPSPARRRLLEQAAVAVSALP